MLARVKHGFAVLAVSALAFAQAPGNPVAVPEQLRTPTGGVTLTGGVLQRTFDNNVKYLLDHFAEDDLLYVFRERAGRAKPPGKPFGWDNGGPRVPGSATALFLMGSGNALRWEQNEALRRRMDAVICGIAETRQPNGFMMGYSEEQTAVRENANYVRAWMTHGLIDASIAGNPKALELIRGQLTWFNHCPYLDKVVDRKRGYIPDHWIPYQGMISSTRMYLSPLGQEDDIKLVRERYQEDWWLDQLLANDDRAIYERPEPHCYEITALEAYLDMYRITGEIRYLQAVLNAWQMLREKWQMPGGSWALCERRRYPPKSYLLGVESRTGELCCAVFWVKLNQRLHRLFPENETFVAEIETSIYNAAIGNQIGTTGIAYHTVLDGRKDEPKSPPQGTCCEGQGTRLYASLPEYLYSLSDRGVVVDLYAPSRIEWKQGGETVRLTTSTTFPEGEDVRMALDTTGRAPLRISLRIPGWVSGAVEVQLNGKTVAAGLPGSYVHLDRAWKAGDELALRLPRKFRLRRYEGYDQVAGHSRYALEHGPILLALTGKVNFQQTMRLISDPARLPDWLKPVAENPLHFRILTDRSDWTLREDEGWSPRSFEYMPYYDVPAGQAFTVFPVIE
jgi:DUF1680 family protein